MTDRRVPHNPDAEAALISACLLYTDRRREALATLDPDDLYVAANRRVYAAIARLETRGEPVDIITVAAEVHTGDGRAGIDPAGVAGYLNSLGAAVNSAAYARIVADMARYRRLLHAADELAEAVYAFDDTAIDQAVKAITEAA